MSENRFIFFVGNDDFNGRRGADICGDFDVRRWVDDRSFLVNNDLDVRRRVDINIILFDDAFNVRSKVDGRIREEVSAEDAIIIFFDV